VSASVELQEAIYSRLVSELGADVTGVHDGPPVGAAYPFISFGPSDYVTEDARGITARRETIQIDVWARGPLSEARALTDRVKGALHEADLTLTVNALVGIWVTGVRVVDDPEAGLGHGVVMVEVLIEESS
jgi:hypothetical protein